MVCFASRAVFILGPDYFLTASHSGRAIIILSLSQCTWSQREYILPIGPTFRLLDAHVTFNNRYITEKEILYTTKTT